MIVVFPKWHSAHARFWYYAHVHHELFGREWNWSWQ